MFVAAPFTLRHIFQQHKPQILLTWALVLLENTLLVLLPLGIAKAIDGLQVNNSQPLLILAGLLLLLIIIGISRRIYDTRTYGNIRVRLGCQISAQRQAYSTSTLNARLNMSRELVDFLEHDLPPLFSGFIQIAASILILASFSYELTVSVAGAGLLMLLIYAGFHQHFSQLNACLNNYLEQQVRLLGGFPLAAIRRYLSALKQQEVKISDSESLLYGLVFLLLLSAVIGNLWIAAHIMPRPSTGSIFAIVSYSLEFVEAAILLPIGLQKLSRLNEISQRLNPPLAATQVKYEN